MRRGWTTMGGSANHCGERAGLHLVVRRRDKHRRERVRGGGAVGGALQREERELRGGITPL